MNRTLRLTALAVILALAGAACSSKTSSTSSSSAAATPTAATIAPLTGAATSLSASGATFPKDIYGAWFDEFNTAEHVQVSYNPVGSGQGIKDIAGKNVDVGASDAPLSAADRATVAAPAELLQFPTVMGGVVVTWNDKSLTKLRLDADTTAKIFLGQITTWDDPAIKALNSGATLPMDKITVVHRSDDSGTTFNFTQYLSMASPIWGARYAKGAKPWPGDLTNQLAGKGNDGVAATVGSTPGAIGYVELNFALAKGLPFADEKNKSGKYVTPSVASISAAAAGIAIPADLGASVLDSSAPAAYPIAAVTFQMVYADNADATKQKAIYNLLGWELTTGQTSPSMGQLYFAPLPAGLAVKARAQLTKLTVAGKAVTSA